MIPNSFFQGSLYLFAVAPQTTVVMQPPPLFGFVGTWVVVLVVEDQPIPLEVASFLTT
ncbi:MAG: hypothetical protein HQL03_03455, partial [Nitrospirae bacterium]|nr:hypothetical protein [Nitrospirota bacterium]